MNIGYSSRLIYDTCVYSDKVKESTDPLNYKLNSDQFNNCDRCQGPRNGYMGYSERQDLTDIESELSNRNIRTSKCKNGKVNPVNPLNHNSHDVKLCGNKLDPDYTRLSYPSSNYRDMSINRFYNTIHDSQEHVFWDFATNTTLEVKDNYHSSVQQIWPEMSGPNEDKTSYVPCTMDCKTNSKCSNGWKKS